MDAVSVVEAVRGLVAGLIEREPTPRGIGISSCGVVDSERGVVVDSVNIPGYEGTDWSEHLREFGLPVRVENDARAAAWAEFHLREDRAVSDWIHLPIGTSIGGGIILGGQLWHGHSFNAGEIGHVTVAADGPVCSCGNVGCLELFVSIGSVLQFVQDELVQGRSSVLKARTRLDLQAISQAEQEGDTLAHEAFARMGHYLGIGLTTLANLFNPPVITVGGGTLLASETILSTARAYVSAHALASARSHLRIEPGKLDNQAGFVGAALLVGRWASY
jgi:glucokinase